MSKLIDQAAFDVALEMATNGSTYDDIARRLCELGYVTDKGFRVSNSHVSKLLLAQGFRRRTTHRKANAPKPAAAARAPLFQAENELVVDVHETRTGIAADVLEMDDVDAEVRVRIARNLLRKGRIP